MGPCVLLCRPGRSSPVTRAAALLEPQALVGREVKIYMNLHRSRPGHSVFSVQDARTRRVIGYAHRITLVHSQCKVSAAGRDRTRREGVRTVHAYIQGTVLAVDRPEPTCTRAIRYNPFLFDGFVWVDTEELVTAVLPYAWCDGTRIWTPAPASGALGVRT